MFGLFRLASGTVMFNKTFYFFIFLAFESAFIAVSPSAAQNLVVNALGSQLPDVLVQNLLGSGVAFSNVTYQGEPSQVETGSSVLTRESSLVMGQPSAWWVPTGR